MKSKIICDLKVMEWIIIPELTTFNCSSSALAKMRIKRLPQ